MLPTTTLTTQPLLGGGGAFGAAVGLGAGVGASSSSTSAAASRRAARAAAFSTYFRRLAKPSQMDFEHTFWLMLQLLTSPKTA